LLALREFYAALTLTPEDEKLIWKKRGLPRVASAAYGFKSSLKSNQTIFKAQG
jgi:hypothetical protein